MINRQKYASICGPIALYNAARFLKIPKVNYETFIDTHTLLNNKPLRGMWNHEMKKVLDFTEIPYKIEMGMRTKDIERELKNGNAVILGYTYPEDSEWGFGAHYIFIDKATPRKLRAWNFSTEAKTPYISKKEFGQLLSHTRNCRPELYDIQFIIEGNK